MIPHVLMNRIFVQHKLVLLAYFQTRSDGPQRIMKVVFNRNYLHLWTAFFSVERTNMLLLFGFFGNIVHINDLDLRWINVVLLTSQILCIGRSADKLSCTLKTSVCSRTFFP